MLFRSDLAMKLGMDVPLFLRDSSALATGRGEILNFSDIDIPYFILVVYPGIHISTPEAYKSLNRSADGKNPTNLLKYISEYNNKIEKLRNIIFNDFEEYVFNAYPEIANIKDKLYQNGARFALLTGSGSAVYGFFSSEEQCRAAEKKFQNYQTFLCKFV